MASFIFGLFVGAIIGFMVWGLCRAAKDADNDDNGSEVNSDGKD